MCFLGCASAQMQTMEKMDGVSFVSPARAFPQHYIKALENINADWMAVIPFAFARENQPAIHFDGAMQWWGEKPAGAKKIIEFAHQENIKVLIKPQVWGMGHWVGDYELNKEEDWQIWEKDYETYIMTFAQIAVDYNVEAFCIGTEYRRAAVQREEYFRSLIKKIRAIYKGKITYAANWDNYENVKFWDDLDFIGIDAYFPLLNEANPSTAAIVEAWKPYKQKLKKFAFKYEKPIAFTEYGYMSCDYTAWRNWENEADRSAVNVNLEAQKNAYEAMFISLWEEPWWVGGFLWKWYDNHEKSGGLNNKDYTPQNKPVEEIIKKWYK